jgi:UDP-N-acetylmuramate--alanine ligase
VSLPAALSRFLQSQNQACVAGTHGKTTTSGMTWNILQHAGLNPSAYIGGVMKNPIRSGVYGAGRMAVLESCEYRKSFLQLSPTMIVLTGIESDHFDYFSSSTDCDQTFRDFVARLPADGALIYNHDCPRSTAIAETCGRRTVSFSLRGGADWNAELLSKDPGAHCRTTHPVVLTRHFCSETEHRMSVVFICKSLEIIIARMA